MDVPRVFKAILQVFLLNLFVQDEPYVQVLRKSCVTIIFSVVPFCAGFSVYWGYLWYTDGSVGALVVACTSMFLWVPVFTGVYLRTRAVKVVTDRMMLLDTVIMNIGLVSLGIGVPMFPIRLLMCCAMFMIIISQPPLVEGLLFVCFASQIVSIYNDAVWDGVNGRSRILLTFPDPVRSSFAEQICNNLTGLAISWLCVGVILFQIRMSVKQFDAANNAVQMARQVVPLIEQYDTDGVAKVLEQYKRSGIDPDLLSSFRAINNNLNRYRPFLPNYVFHDEDDVDPGPSKESDGDYIQVLSTDVALTPLTAAPPAITFPRADSALRPHHDSDGATVQVEISSVEENPLTPLSASVADSDKSQPSHAGGARTTATTLIANNNAAQMPHVEDLDGDSFEVNQGPGHGIGPRRHSSMSPARPRASTPHTAAAYFGRITWAVADFREFTQACLAGGEEGRLLADLCDWIHVTAAATKASIHSLVGDEVTVSWNATYRVAQPEAKAAGFLCRLKLLIAQHAKGLARPNASGTGAEVQLVGVACSGAAMVNSVNSTTTKHQSLLVHLPWSGRLQGALHLARRHRTLLIDVQTHAVTHYNFNAVPVDIVFYRMLASSGVAASSLTGQVQQRRAPGNSVLPKLYGEGPLFEGLFVDGSDSVGYVSPQNDSMEASITSAGSSCGPTSVQSSYSVPNTTPLTASPPVRDGVAGAVRRSTADTQGHECLLFHLLGEVQHSSEEWMYQLDRKKAASSELGVIKEALIAAKRGEFHAATTKLQTLTDVAVASDPMVRRLHDFCATQQQQRPHQ